MPSTVISRASVPLEEGGGGKPMGGREKRRPQREDFERNRARETQMQATN